MDTAAIDIDLLIKLKKEGISHSEIGRRLGVTSNVIHGHVGRLVLKGVLEKGRTSYIKGTNLSSFKSKKDHKLSGVKYEEPDIFAAKGNKTIMELKVNDCRFLTNDGLYCGKPCCDRLDGTKSSWCSAHHVKLTTKPPKRI